MAGRPRLALVAAVARNGAIGRGNTLPWRLPEDLRHFKSVTLGKPIVMGRKTFDSIGRPLPGRRNIVVSRRADWRADGVDVAHGVDEALALAAERTPDEVCIVGGAQLYRLTLDRADRLLITEVELDVPDADAFFPPIDPATWQAHSRDRQQSSTGLGYSIVEYLRR